MTTVSPPSTSSPTLHVLPVLCAQIFAMGGDDIRCSGAPYLEMHAVFAFQGRLLCRVPSGQR